MWDCCVKEQSGLKLGVGVHAIRACIVRSIVGGKCFDRHETHVLLRVEHEHNREILASGQRCKALDAFQRVAQLGVCHRRWREEKQPEASGLEGVSGFGIDAWLHGDVDVVCV